MRKFELTSPAFSGHITYGFDDTTGRLLLVDMSEAELSKEQWECICKKIPANISNINVAKGRTGVITEVTDGEVTFDMFWQRYDDKARSSKVKTRKAWDKMPAREQVKAYRFIPRYFESIPPGVCKKYATTYLSDQLWNN